ncbi:MAG: glucose-6-phosphate isomerase [Thermodesulfobacteriota bacterium]
MPDQPDLTSLPAHATLQKLAHSPPDLRHSLTPARLQEYRCQGGEFQLLYGGQRVNGAIMAALQELADEAGVVEQFQAMKGGAVMNRIKGHESENRQVLHTACRDIFSESPLAPEATAQAEAELAKLEIFLGELSDGRLTNREGKKFTTMIQVGIGGSDLGPRALYHGLAAYALPGRQVKFIANVDPDDAAAVLAGTDLSRTLINVVSKSGTTQETLANEELVKAALAGAGLDPAQHMVAVTGQGSPLDNPANYRRSFYMYDYIGGRYSATSMVGGVMLGFALGYGAFREILEGAAAMDRAAEEREIRKNIPLLLALLGVWNHNYLGHESLAILPYSQGLIRFPAHLQQCDMESNGKGVNRDGAPLSYQSGPVIWGEPGTNGQHAFYQLIHQGTSTVPVEFIGFRQSQYGKDIKVGGTTSQAKLLANMLAQSLALAKGQEHPNPNKKFPGNRPNSILIAERLTPRAMGGLLALYEAKIVFQGFIWNINSFDQEGVQLGKVLANQLLSEMSGRGGADETAHEMLRLAGMI